jgi:hypothetical protein
MSDLAPEELNPHMLATLTPEQRAAAVRDTLATLAGNMEVLASELRDVLAAATEFTMPDVPIGWLAEAEQKFATGVRCIARSAGLVAAE